MNKIEQSKNSRDRLVNDLKVVIKDAEELLKNTGQQVDDRYGSAKAKFQSSLINAKTGLSKLEDTLVTRTKNAADTTEQYVQDHPWKSIGAGILAGLIFGVLMGRK